MAVGIFQAMIMKAYNFLECEPITKAQFEAGFAKYDAYKAQQDAQQAATKAALLDRLGITADEAKLLLS